MIRATTAAAGEIGYVNSIFKKPLWPVIIFCGLCEAARFRPVSARIVCHVVIFFFFFVIKNNPNGKWRRRSISVVFEWRFQWEQNIEYLTPRAIRMYTSCTCISNNLRERQKFDKLAVFIILVRSMNAMLFYALRIDTESRTATVFDSVFDVGILFRDNKNNEWYTLIRAYIDFINWIRPVKLLVNYHL